MRSVTDKLLILCIILTAAVVRFVSLENIPNGLQQDELSIGYNAYSILKTGNDEHGKFLPQHFIAFGEYKLPLSIYLTVPAVYLFGLTPFAVRFPSALLGTFTVLVVILLTRQLFYNDSYQKRISLISGLFLATNPWHVFFSRGAFEVTTALFFLSLSCLLFVFGLRKQQVLSVYCSIISALLALYTYNTMRFTIPILCIVFFVLFIKKMKTNRKKIHVFSMSIVSCLLLIPFLSTFFTASQATSGTVITTSAVIQSDILEKRSYMVGIPQFVQKIFYSQPIQTSEVFLKHILNNLNASFYFLNGPTHGNHGIGTHGLFFIYQLPLLLIGLTFFQRVHISQLLLLIILFTTVVTTALTRESPYATRSFFLLLPFIIVISYGIIRVETLLNNQSRLTKRLGYLLLGFIILWEGVSYTISYTQRFPIAYAKQWRSEDKYLAEYINNNKDRYNKIVIDPNAGMLYSSLLFYLKIPPEEFIKTAQRGQPDSEGFIPVNRFSNIEYRKIQWMEDMRTPGLLLITQPELKPDTVPATKTFLYPIRPVVINQGQQILQFPAQDVAYVLVETSK